MEEAQFLHRPNRNNQPAGGIFPTRSPRPCFIMKARKRRNQPRQGRVFMRQALFLLLLLLALPPIILGQKPDDGRDVKEPKDPKETKETKESTDSPDEQTVKAAHLPVTGAGLVEFFQKRSQLSAESGPIKNLIGELNEKDAKTRDKAFGGLVQYGMLA